MPLGSVALASLLALSAAPKATPPAGGLDPIVVEAIRLYDQGSYEDAKRDLEGLDAAGLADGPLLYRLFFCERATGNEDAAQAALKRAAKALEAELPHAKTLETSFYLANAYANLNRPAEAGNVARTAIESVDAKRLKMPETPIGFFQLGKLYQDAGRSAEASTYYTKALDGFDLKDGLYAGNARWALRYVGNDAYGRGDYKASADAFVRLTKLGGALPGDWIALAIARVRSGGYAGAAEAWKAAVKLDPAGADDARYSGRLADVAAGIGTIPTSDGSGVAFTAMTQAVLESTLKDQAAAARTLQTRAAEAMHGKALDKNLRTELAGKLLAARRIFVAAGLEYSVRRLPIRETAFREGYAVLIFQDTEWALPPDPS